MFNIRCAFRHLELLTRCALVQAKYLKYGFVMVLHVIGPNFTRESDAQNAGNGVSEVQISKFFRGGMPPDPPNYVTYSRMIRSDFSLDPPLVMSHLTTRYCTYCKKSVRPRSNVALFMRRT